MGRGPGGEDLGPHQGQYHDEKARHGAEKAPMGPHHGEGDEHRRRGDIQYYSSSRHKFLPFRL